jgi:ankyrin repeat protein
MMIAIFNLWSLHVVVRLPCKILDNGTDPNWCNNIGITALHMTSRNPDDNVARCLLEHGSAVDCRTTSGETPLHMSATHGNVGVVRVLLENGADIHGRRTDGETALSLAVLHDQCNAVRCLLDHGADPGDIKNPSDEILAVINGRRVKSATPK